MGISLMKVNDNVNENYYYDGRYNRRNVEGKASDMPVAAGRRLINNQIVIMELKSR